VRTIFCCFVDPHATYAKREIIVFECAGEIGNIAMRLNVMLANLSPGKVNENLNVNDMHSLRLPGGLAWRHFTLTPGHVVKLHILLDLPLS
jgi:hypothetical protein